MLASHDDTSPHLLYGSCHSAVRLQFLCLRHCHVEADTFISWPAATGIVLY